MKRLSLEAKVGFFILVAIALLGYMATRVQGPGFARKGAYTLTAYFDSATGLAKNVPVEIAGVQVGIVRDISLDNGRARVTLEISEGVRLTKNSEALIRTKGILGDKYVEIMPGLPGAPPLSPGDRIVQSTSPTDVDELMAELGRIAGDVRKVTRSLAEALGGEDGARNLADILQNLRDVSMALNETVQANQKQAGQAIENIAAFSATLRELGEENRQDLRKLVAAASDASRSLEITLAQLSEISQKVNQGEGALGQLVNDPATARRITETLASLESLSAKLEGETVESLNSTLASWKDISNRINRGEGTLGRLIHDDETINQVNSALANVNEYLGKIESFRTYISYSGEYLFDKDDARNYISLRIQPKEDKYYLLGVVDDPPGKETVTHITTVTNGVTTNQTVTELEEDQIKITAQIAKRYGPVALRGGVFLSTGGVAVDYFLFDDQVTFSLEAFDFDPEEAPHLKFRADWSPIRHLHLLGGVDDFVGGDDRRSYFVGAGISFYDEDIKTLISGAPLPSP
ncbi:MAG: MCE family protein [Deltaproteobacteria bacterium]|nr:MCE family protein [Deltaproteobacteria bacterium]